MTPAFGGTIDKFLLKNSFSKTWGQEIGPFPVWNQFESFISHRLNRNSEKSEIGCSRTKLGIRFSWIPDNANKSRDFKEKPVEFDGIE